MVWLMSCSLLLGTSLPAVSQAGMIGTQTLLEQQTGDAHARVQAFISREHVRDQIIALGADPVEVEDRLAALSTDELRMLEHDIDTMPAGGIFAVIGIVFVVLIILELTGTIDIFKKA
jgi:hypothetical protein